MLSELGKALKQEISEQFIYVNNAGNQKTGVINFKIPTYAANKFIVPFSTTITDEKNHDKYTEVDYLFVVGDNKVIERLYAKKIDDDYRCFAKHKKYHMELIKKKEPELVDFVSNYNVSDLKDSPRSTEETFQEALIILKCNDFINLSGLWK